DAQFAGDLVVFGDALGTGNLSADLAPAIADLPEVAVASPLANAPVRVEGSDEVLAAFDPATLAEVIDPDVRQGSLSAIGADQVAVSQDFLDDHGLALGDPVTLAWADGAEEQPTIGAVYVEDNLIGDMVVPREAFLAHTSLRGDAGILVAL